MWSWEFLSKGSKVPTKVTLGHYATGAHGKLSSPDTRVDEKVCERGHYCIDGERKACPGGTYGNRTGLSTSMCSGTCRAGYYCPEGSTTELECGGERFFCPEGSSRRERVLSGGGVGPGNPDQGAFYTVGDVSNTESTLTRSDQKRCPQGSYCKNGKRYLCPAGRYGSRVGENKIRVLVNALKVFTVLKGAPERMKEPVEAHLTIVRRAVRLQFKLRLAISHMRRQRNI